MRGGSSSRPRTQSEDLSQPNVAMFMEPSASDWHLVELVVKNFGQKPAYGIQFEFASPPTVPRYESADADNYVDIVPLKLPAEIPYLAPSQEWRTVWDSALDRKQLGESIGSRFAGAVTFYDQPKSSRQGKAKAKRSAHQFRTPAVLDWAHAASGRTAGAADHPRPGPPGEAEAGTAARSADLLPLRDDRKPPRGAAGRDQQDQRRRQRTTRPLPQPVHRRAGRTAARRRRSAPVSVDELPPQQPRYEPAASRSSSSGTRACRPTYDDPPPPYDEEPPYDDDDAQTRVINGGIAAASAALTRRATVGAWLS